MGIAVIRRAILGLARENHIPGPWIAADEYLPTVETLGRRQTHRLTAAIGKQLRYIAHRLAPHPRYIPKLFRALRCIKTRFRPLSVHYSAGQSSIQSCGPDR